MAYERPLRFREKGCFCILLALDPARERRLPEGADCFHAIALRDSFSILHPCDIALGRPLPIRGRASRVYFAFLCRVRLYANDYSHSFAAHGGLARIPHFA